MLKVMVTLYLKGCAVHKTSKTMTYSMSWIWSRVYACYDNCH